MNSINYRETELWAQTKALAQELYELTSNWSEDGCDLAKEIRGIARTIVRAVPGAFKKAGITGNIHLRMTSGTFGELEALLEIASNFGHVAEVDLRKALETARPVEEKFKELSIEAKKRASELMRKRTSLFGGGIGDDDDDF